MAGKVLIVDDDTEITKGLTVGADAFVTKPVSTRHLVDQVTALLAGGR